LINYTHELYKKFGFPIGESDKLFGDREAQEFRLKFLQEELDELREAFTNGDRVKAFDALLDLAYVAYGTALFMGVDIADWHCGMAAVHKANMAKILVESADSSKRGQSLDLVKPEGWVGPEAELEKILKRSKPS
jgi:predicted HAD superfamily Cof-like phosphohydrolase